jgi:LmbE family N-acetylglucosaminyl deacetylase
MENERILIVVAHPDDEILGFGGGMAVLSSNNTFKVAILSGNADERRFKPSQKDLEEDCRRANLILGIDDVVLGDFVNLKFNNVPHVDIVKWIEEIVLEFRPSVIITHHPNDLNNDHFIVSEATMVASKISFRMSVDFKIKMVAFMEILSSTDWSRKSDFTPNCFVGLGKVNVDKKILSLSNYRGVMRDYPHSRSFETVLALATLRGSQSNQLYAEGLQIVYSIID